MNETDYVLLILTAFLTLRGMQKGLIREFLGLLSIFTGFLVALSFGRVLADELGRFIASSQGALLLSYALLFVSVSLIISYLARLLTRLSKKLALSFMNRLLGGLFGLGKAIVILFFLSYLLTLFAKELEMKLPSYLSDSLVLDLVNRVHLLLSN